MKLYSGHWSERTGATINTWTVVKETPKTYVVDRTRIYRPRRVLKSDMLAYDDKLFPTRLEAVQHLESNAQVRLDNAWDKLLAAIEQQEQARELADEEQHKEQNA